MTGLRINDGLISTGRIMTAKVHFDAIADPVSEAAVGGAGDSSEMDDVQMSEVVTQIAHNLDKVEALLADPQAFFSAGTSDDDRALEAAKVRLEVVAAAQRRILDLLSTTDESNETTDLMSKCDPVDCSVAKIPPRVSLPKALAAAITSEQDAESVVAPAIVDVVQRCSAH